MKNLLDQLMQIANIAHDAHRDNVRAALMTGAELAFTRARELGDSYNVTSGLEQAEKELRDDGSRYAKVPFSVRAPAPETETAPVIDGSSL